LDAARFVRAVRDAHQQLRSRYPSLKTVLFYGPNARIAPEDRAVRGLIALDWSLALPQIMARADAVVSQAGYNAINEIRALHKSATLIPGYRKMEDQRARAHRLVSLGAATIAAPRADSIAKHVARLLASPRLRSRMQEAHNRQPLVRGNHDAALALLRPVHLGRRKVTKVVIIAHDFPPRIGGMETAAHSLAQANLQLGVNVVVYTSTGLGRLSAPWIAPMHGVLPRAALQVRAMYVPLRPPKTIDLLGDLLLTIHALLVDAPDVVHLAHAGLAPWIPALRACLPCVVTSHVHGNDLIAPWVEHAGQGEAYRTALVDGLNQSDGVLAVSEYSRGLAVSAGVSADRVRVLSNGVDASRFTLGPIDSSLRDRLGICATDEVVLTVSRLAQRKGHRALVAALPAILKHRPQALFAFTGCHDGLLSEIRALACDLRVESRVRALGWISDQDLPALYRLARLFVLAPDKETDADVEGFGIALLEAAASGLPTVSSRTGGVPEAVVDGETGITVNASDTGDLARAVVRLLNDPDEARTMGEAGRRRGVRDFSWNAIANGLVQQWNAALCTLSRPSPKQSLGLGTLLAGGASCGDPSVLTTRRQLGKVRHAADLGWAARKHVYAIRQGDKQRQDKYRRWIEAGRTLRFRATSDLSHRFSQALEDCRALGYRPDVEVKLRAFVTPVFQAQVLPLIRGVHLLHGIPCSQAKELLDDVGRLDISAWHALRSLRLYVVPELAKEASRAIECAPQAHLFRKAFQQRGVTVVPPPELMRYLSLTPSPGPVTAMVEPSNRCNLSCPTCPTGQGKIPALADMSPEHFGRVLAGLGTQVQTLALWNYGEPTMNPDLPTLIACAKARGVATVKVSSNGLALRGERGRALLQSGLDVLILSVDGASQPTYEKFRQRGCFEVVAEAVRGLCAEKRLLGLSRPSIELQFIVMRHNEHEIGSIRNLARSWGVDKLRLKTFGASDVESRQFIPLTHGLSRYKADGATPKQERLFCPLPWDHVVVGVDGAISPCCYLRPDMGDAFVMGNLFETPFVEIWRGIRYQAFRAAMLERRQEMPVCRTCHGNVFDRNASVEALS
jgi:glycosyltransferase involved in cell wall biosynthesis/MoaA/NifB/PqqE/SkfB family radical SAM enzyme